jgi:hypothetical protein
VKVTVYREKVQNMNELYDRISRSSDFVTNEMPANTWREAECHLHVCRSNNGAHIEFWGAQKKLCGYLKMYHFV